jgi:hypothetical protein
MIRKSGYQFSDKIMLHAKIKAWSAKSLPGLDPGRKTAFPKSMPSGLTRGWCSTKKLERQSIQSEVIVLK